MMDALEHHAYSVHGHTRSISSFASTITPISPTFPAPKPLGTSPTHLEDAPVYPIELDIPLPSSSNCSDDGQDLEGLEISGPSPAILGSIITEASEYTKGQIPVAGDDDGHDDDREESASTLPVEGYTISLEELSRLARLEKYQNRHATSGKCRSHELALSCSLHTRLIRSTSLAYRSLIESFRMDKQADFVKIYGTCETLQEVCTSTRQLVPQADLRDLKDQDPDLTLARSVAWIMRLPQKHRVGILDFLTMIRTEPNFLADRLCSLSPSELTALSSAYQSAGVTDSILHTNFHATAQNFPKGRWAGTDSRRVHHMQGFHKKDPLFTLFYIVFDDSAKLGSQEHSRKGDILSTACARILTDGKRGSDDFAFMALNAFTPLTSWAFKPKLEMYLMKLLQDGAFLLETPASQPIDFTQPVESRNARAAVAVSEFFDNALRTLFDLLVDGSLDDSVPKAVAAFVQTILTKIKDSRTKARAKTLMISKWYFSMFLSYAIVYPESQGMMMTSHISDEARRAIFRELVVRMQKQVSDFTSPWQNTMLVAPEIKSKIEQIIQLFDPLESTVYSALPRLDQGDKEVKMFLMLSPQDVTTLIGTLYPERLLSSSSMNSVFDAKLSAASSATGSSTLTTGTAEHRSTLPSSTAPSISGTSMTSDTLLSDYFTTDPEADHGDSQALQPMNQQLGMKEPIEISEDLAQQLPGICDELKNLCGVEDESDTFSDNPSASDWASIYVLNGGEKLSLGPFDTIGGSQLSPSISWDNGHSESDGVEYRALKDAVLQFIDDHDSNLNQTQQSGTAQIVPSSQYLRSIFEAGFHGAMIKSRSRLDFQTAHFWWKSLRLLLGSQSADLPSLLHEVSKDLLTNIDAHVHSIKLNDAWLQSLEDLHLRQRRILQDLDKRLKALRIKMWYVSDVRNSSTYEDALNVSRALKAMARPPRSRQSGSIGNWARHKLRPSTGQNRLESQTLEILAAHPDHGGPSKLADEQVELTSRWLTRNSIENFCKGEERIHRFCFEVQKCVNKLAGGNLLESPVLWSSSLFEREKFILDTRSPRVGAHNIRGGSSSTTPNITNRGSSQFSSSIVSPAYPQNAITSDRLWNMPIAGQETFGFSSHAQASSQDTMPVKRSPAMFWPTHSIATPFPTFPPRAMEPAAHFGANAPLHGRSEQASDAKSTFVAHLKPALRSLLISDLGYRLWTYGSETDSWVISDLSSAMQNSPQEGKSDATTSRAVKEETSRPAEDTDLSAPGRLGDYTEPKSSKQVEPSKINYDPQSFESKVPDDATASSSQIFQTPFPFSEAYKKLLENLSLNPDPYVKLQMLYEVEILALNFIHDTRVTQIIANPPSAKPTPRSTNYRLSGTRSKGVPRTKATSLEETIANCTERRAGTFRLGNPIAMPVRGSTADIWSNEMEPDIPDTDDIVNTLQSIFRSADVRPKTLFRDLQYIAAFIPSDILDKTEKGKAFWDAGLAALALKEDLCESMIDRANKITAYHLSTHKTSDHSTDPASTQLHPLAATTLRDAAQLWTITAKEGSPFAARELGLFYLTHPDLLPRVTLPLSKPKDVFKSALPTDRNGGEAERLDPLTFAMAFHWMEAAANGGDKDARDFLRGNGELSAGR